jgi:hypothetical protein
MSTTRQSLNDRLRVSAYDRVSSWLISLLVISSVIVLSLLLLYFARQLRSFAISPAIKPISSGGGGGGGGGAGDFAAGLDDELAIERISDAPDNMDMQINETLSALSSAVIFKADMLSIEELETVPNEVRGRERGDNRRPGYGSGRGGGFGSGIGRGVGSGIGDGIGTGMGGAAEPRREIRFEPADLTEYAQMLDFFGVELGVLSVDDNQVFYASNLRQASPTVREGSPSQEERLYMIPTVGQFASLDRRLVAKAGIGDRGQIVMQFYPTATQAMLQDLERKHAEAKSRRIADIRLTIFRVTRTGDRFAYSVEEQFYR